MTIKELPKSSRYYHIYTFENICMEDPNISLGDETARIFLNASSKMNDISRELKAFLDYVAGEKSEDTFVKKLEEAVREAKKSREWRREYMTLLMRDQENLEKGMEKGMERGKIYGAILMCRDFNMPEEVISKRLQEKFQLSEAEADYYLKTDV